ncbi:unnamed protein product [Lupinus luteus]|uniref:Uncharacterized protein n=1 Tax=Lupinus luteus TaxID=3873 RepID=A0AAV1Y780_LUPLU
MMSLEIDANGSSTVTCHKRGEQINKWEAAEAHHLSKHVGTLLDGEPIISLPPKSVELKKEILGLNLILQFLTSSESGQCSLMQNWYP